MRSIERGCQRPENICLKKDKQTKKLIRNIEILELYFRAIRKTRGSSVMLCNNYLKILN